MNDGRNRVTWLVENVAHNYRRSTSELQNDFCFNEHHSEKFTQSTYGFTNEIYRIPLDFGANWKRSYSFLPRRCLFPLTNRILQFKSFHRDTSTHRRCDADQSEKIMQLVTELTAYDLLPLCFAEGKGFCKLTHYTEPEYTVPSESHNGDVCHSYLTYIISLTFVNCHVFFI